MSSQTTTTTLISERARSVSSTTSPFIPRIARSFPQSQPRMKKVAGFMVAIPDYRDLFKNLAGTICSIDRPTLKDGDKEVDIKITDFKAVAAYNWDDKTDARIIVPGSPRIWHGQSLPFTIPKDSGQVFVDQNSGRLATSPLLPLVIAVHHHDPRFRMGEMDFITDRNSIRKLYRWVVQSPPGYPSSEIFRIDVELVGKTILLQRWEVQSTQRSGPGYEKNFQKCMTSATEETSTATGHHRIVSFKFGDKRILMRCTTDACLPDTDAVTDKNANNNSVDDLTSKLMSLNLRRMTTSRPIRKIATFQGNFLTVQTAGKLVPQESIIELKTKGSFSPPVNQDDLCVQLMFANINNLHTGRHERGTFHTVEKETLSSVKEKVGEGFEDGLKLLKKALDEIQRVVLANHEDSGSLSLVLRKGDRGLEVLKRKGEDGLLPENILAFIH